MVASPGGGPKVVIVLRRKSGVMYIDGVESIILAPTEVNIFGSELVGCNMRAKIVHHATLAETRADLKRVKC